MCVVWYLPVDVQASQHCAALLKLAEWPPVSAAPLPEPRDVSAQSSWGCSSRDEAPSCSTADTQTDIVTEHRHGNTSLPV